MVMTTYDEFVTVYRATFARMFSYELNQAGSVIYCEQLAALADTYPAWLEQFEASLEPALPGAEHVRTQEVALPQFELPAQSFTLTAPEETAPRQSSLF